MKTTILLFTLVWLSSGQQSNQEPRVAKDSNGVTAPLLLSKANPEYTVPAWQAHRQGVMVLYVDINPEGRAVNPRVVRGLGLGLDEQAIGTVVNLWRFRPGMKDGKPVTVGPLTIEVTFRLEK